jgi:butyryl-CoA dehydrogenase
MGEKDDCEGYLLGEPHHGLAYMFQMMNEARIGVGTSAVATASAAYYAALEYAGERPQGRRLNEKDPSLPQTMIINHADVRRMLFKQKAIVEGALSLILKCSLYADLAVVSEGAKKEKYESLLDLLTPVAKAYPSEMGIESISAGLQCLGGYGYCTDFPLEQYYRDVRIMAIYEGTTGIQSLDLLGRKVTMNNGRGLLHYGEEVENTIELASELDEIAEYAAQLNNELANLRKVTQHLTGLAAKDDDEVFLADANLYMELFSHIAVGWQWLEQAVVAVQRLAQENIDVETQDFYQSKIHTLKYFFSYELPRTKALTTRLIDNRKLTIKDSKEYLM